MAYGKSNGHMLNDVTWPVAGGRHSARLAETADLTTFLITFMQSMDWTMNKTPELTLDALLLADGQGDDVWLVVLELQLFDFFTGTTSVVFLARLLFRFKAFVLPCQTHTQLTSAESYPSHSWHHVYSSDVNKAKGLASLGHRSTVSDSSLVGSHHGS